MDDDISALEQKVEELLGICGRLRAENHELRARTASLEADNRRIAERVEWARLRLEALRDKLPA
jgi:cell division protein ZapB